MDLMGTFSIVERILWALLKLLYKAFWFKDLSGGTPGATFHVNQGLNLHHWCLLLAVVVSRDPFPSHGSSSPRNDPGLAETRKSLEARARPW